MSGHNKWSTIKHKKAATDAKRGKVFSKIAKEIMVAAKMGGGDPSANITLRALIQKARSENMPADNVERAIKKGTGDIEGVVFEEMVYEGYASGGVAVVVEVLSDNKNRSSSDIKHAFSKHNANLAAQGSVSRIFKRVGQIVVADDATSEDSLMELALEAGADDLSHEDGQFIITTDPTVFMDVVDAIEKAGLPMQMSEMTKVPETTVPVTDKGQAASLMKLIDALEDLEDVQNVYTNFDIADELMEELEG
ncbi:MAG: YebC/PmpR family DNA-binding transcriptional regulator [Spartobacteria bacterium]|nr:YebC/PmpR family DNA-binding transcriptional regulator [Spartobacteria bacterium]